MPEHVGLFLPLPERLARQYPPDGKKGEDDSPPHVTFLYIGDVPDERVEELERVLRRVVQAVPPLELTLLPPRRFKNQEGQTILHSPVACPVLESAHDALKGALERRGFEVKAYDDFRPHVTIEYVDHGDRARFDYLAPQGRWRADSVGFWAEDDRRTLPLGRGHVTASRVRGAQMTMRGKTVTAALKMIAGGLVIGDRIVKDAAGVKAGSVVADLRLKRVGKRSAIVIEFQDGSTVTVGRWTAFEIERAAWAAVGRDVRRQIVEWFRANPNPSDDAVHEFAESLGIDTHEFEAMIYPLLTDFVQRVDANKRDVIACMLRAGRPDLAQAIAGVRKPGDLLRSFNTLAKYNDGLWKSEKQGRFLWSWADGDSFVRGGSEAVAWAKTTGWYDAKDKRQRVVQFVLRLEGFGSRDVSKTRYSGSFVLIDGTGVLATAGFKVKHAKKDDDDGTFKPIPGSAKTRFVRDRKVVPPINVDPAGEEARRKAKQIKANEPVIKAIESIPDWQSQDIFVDFRDILLAGGTLSPNMMRVVERNVPLPVMNVGDADDVAAKMEACDRWIEKVLPILTDPVIGIEQRQYEHDKREAEYLRRPEPARRNISAKLKQNWAQYRAGTYADPSASTHPYMLHPFDILSGFFRDHLRFKWIRYFKGSRGVNWQVGYWTLKLYVTKAIPKLKRGKVPTKTEMVVIRTLLAFHDKLVGTSPDAFKRWFAKE